MDSNSTEKKSGITRKASSLPDWVRMWVPLVLLAGVLFGVAFYFVKPAPPSHVVIAAGARTGKYYAMASRYADYFGANGITLEVRETAGSVENYQLLQQADSGVDIAIVQGGSAPADVRDHGHIQAIASIYYEPVMVFFRGDRVTQLSELAGKKIAIGIPGSGVRLLATSLLTEAGVTDKTDGTSLVDLGGDPAANALSTGDIDAAFYVIAPDVPVVSRLLSTPGIHLMSFDQAHAYGRLHPFLSAATLYQGVVDVKRNLPATDISLIASPATLVTRDKTHSAVIELLVRAAQEYNSKTTLLSDAKTFPSELGSELPVNRDAKYYLGNPPTILHRTLPFWLASMFDRLLIMILPLLVVLIPLFRSLPVAMRWRVQRKLLHRYKQVRSMEEHLTAASPNADLQAGRSELLAMEHDLATLKLPINYARDLYHLRLHVSFVRQRLDGWIKVD